MISKRKEGKLNSNSIAKKLVSMQLDTALLAPIVKMEGIGGKQVVSYYATMPPTLSLFTFTI